MATWNPPPPPSRLQDDISDDVAQELLKNEDRIGDTLISKAWILSLLVKLVGTVEGGGKLATGSCGDGSHVISPRFDGMEGAEQTVSAVAGAQVMQGMSDPSHGTSHTSHDMSHDMSHTSHDMSHDMSHTSHDTSHASEAVRDDEGAVLDKDTEDDICKLWDVTSNAEVVHFLNHHHGVQLLAGVMIRQPHPRIMVRDKEMCVGVLSNMACIKEVCASSLCDDTIISLMLSFLSDPDPGVLTELSRLIVTCLSHDKVQQCWLQAIRSSTTFIDDLIFILQSSTCKDLLRSISVLLDRVLDVDGIILKEWASRNLVVAICEAIKETCSSPCDSFDVSCTLMLSLQLFSTIEEGVSLLTEDDMVCLNVTDFLVLASGTEDWNEDTGRGLMASLSLCDCLLAQDDSQCIRTLLSESVLLKYLKKLPRDDNVGDDGWSGITAELRDGIAITATSVLKHLQKT